LKSTYSAKLKISYFSTKKFNEKSTETDIAKSLCNFWRIIMQKLYAKFRRNRLVTFGGDRFLVSKTDIFSKTALKLLDGKLEIFVKNQVLPF